MNAVKYYLLNLKKKRKSEDVFIKKYQFRTIASKLQLSKNTRLHSSTSGSGMAVSPVCRRIEKEIQKEYCEVPAPFKQTRAHMFFFILSKKFKQSLLGL